jgi:hypothetical protein
MKKRKQRAWTKEEDVFLKKNFVKMSRQQIADRLDRGFHSVHKRMRKLGLKRNEGLRNSLIGKKFGKLLVVRFIKTDKRRSYFEVRCDCGTIKILQHTNFTGGNTVSCGCKSRENIKINQYRGYYSSYKRVAKKRGLSFQLSFKDFMYIILQNCYYCGNEPRKIPHVRSKKSEVLKDAHISANGIDRLKQNIGYVKTNCVPCCPTCNFMKQEHDDTIFLSIISKIYNIQKRKKKS